MKKDHNFSLVAVTRALCRPSSLNIPCYLAYLSFYSLQVSAMWLKIAFIVKENYEEYTLEITATCSGCRQDDCSTYCGHTFYKIVGQPLKRQDTGLLLKTSIH